MHESSFARMRLFVEEFLADRRGHPLRVLDVASSDVNGSYRSLFDDPHWTYVGLDVKAGPGVDVVVDRPYRWKGVKRESFDIVISGQGLEHVEFPWVTLLEMERLLRRGGLCCIIVPSAGPEHRYPLDCWRFYRDGLVAMAHWADLDVVRAETHWIDEGWGPDSDQWHDSVLVARKPLGARRLLGPAKRALLLAAVSFQATRRQAIATASAPDDATAVLLAD